MDKEKVRSLEGLELYSNKKKSSFEVKNLNELRIHDSILLFLYRHQVGMSIITSRWENHCGTMNSHDHTTTH